MQSYQLSDSTTFSYEEQPSLPQRRLLSDGFWIFIHVVGFVMTIASFVVFATQSHVCTSCTSASDTPDPRITSQLNRLYGNKFNSLSSILTKLPVFVYTELGNTDLDHVNIEDVKELLSVVQTDSVEPSPCEKLPSVFKFNSLKPFEAIKIFDLKPHPLINITWIRKFTGRNVRLSSVSPYTSAMGWYNGTVLYDPHRLIHDRLKDYDSIDKPVKSVAFPDVLNHLSFTSLSTDRSEFWIGWPPTIVTYDARWITRYTCVVGVEVADAR